MVPALLIGRGGSRGVPGKNTMPVLGRPLMTYPVLAARGARRVGDIFLSTDDDGIRRLGESLGCRPLYRPPELATHESLVEDVVVDAFARMEAVLGTIELFVLLFCNSATIRPGLIDEGIELLLADPTLDSAVSVSAYNEYSPVRAMQIDDAGLVQSYVDLAGIPGASCDRDSARTCWFCDCSAWILRRRCTDLSRGRLPFRWIGTRVMPLRQIGGLDVDHPYGIAHTEWWLREHGFTERSTPYDEGASP